MNIPHTCIIQPTLTQKIVLPDGYGYCPIKIPQLVMISQSMLLPLSLKENLIEYHD